MTKITFIGKEGENIYKNKLIFFCTEINQWKIKIKKKNVCEQNEKEGV